jgi:uncharacterized protein (DUF1499 family)
MMWLVAAPLIAAVAALIAGQAGLLEGKEPADLGVRDGRLKPPSMSENSVSSQADLYPDHPMRAYARIAPLKFEGDGKAAMVRLRHVIESMEGARVVRAEPGYLYAQFKTRWMHFVDDAEFLLDEDAGVIQVRSASRIGKGDLGVNRARIESIRARFRS